MPGFIVSFANVVMCTHGGQATPVPPAGRVMATGLGVVTLAHSYVVVGCGFPAATLGVQPPCVNGRVLNGTKRVVSMGMPLVLVPDSAAGSMGLPNPTPLIFAPAGQSRVFAT